MWYIHELQQEIVSLSSEATTLKKDSQILNSVNLGARDALAVIKFQLEA